MGTTLFLMSRSCDDWGLGMSSWTLPHKRCEKRFDVCLDKLGKEYVRFLLPWLVYRGHGLCFCGAMNQGGIRPVERALVNHWLVVTYCEEHNCRIEDRKYNRYFDILARAEHIYADELPEGFLNE